LQSRNNKRVDEDQSNIQISTDLEGSISNKIVSSSCQTELSITDIGELENSSNKFQKVIKDLNDRIRVSDKNLLKNDEHVLNFYTGKCY